MDLRERILKVLKTHQLTRHELSSSLGVSVNRVKKLLWELQNEMCDVQKEKRFSGIVYFLPQIPYRHNYRLISDASPKEETIRFGLFSDTHIGSKYCDEKGIRHYLEALAHRGVKKVFHAGDVFDGNAVYKGQDTDLCAWGLDEQVERAKKIFDDFKNISVEAISGNHDYSFTKQNGSKPIRILESRCTNTRDLGDIQADIVISGVKIRLIHGAGGVAYARSYPAQVYLRNVAEVGAEELPKVLCMGHYHFGMSFSHMGVQVIHPASFLKPLSEFTTRRGLVGPNGGYDIEMVVKNGKILEFIPRFIQA